MKLLTSRVAKDRRFGTRRAAFTLVEVLVVVAILVILAGVGSIGLFRFIEDAKVDRAKSDMQAIDKAYKTYYSKNFSWPTNINMVAPLMEQGNAALLDPWGQTYQEQRMQIQAADGTEQDRWIFSSQPPNGKPLIQYPDGHVQN